MALDLTKYTGEEREQLVYVGRQYGSGDTLKQAEKTLLGLDKYGAQLKAQGFSASDTQRLQGARDALLAAGVSRDAVQGQKKVTNKSYDTAIKEGKIARESARSIIENTLRDVRGSADEEQRKCAQLIQTTLTQTGTAPEEATALSTQLELLRAILEKEAIASFLKERGGVEGQEEVSSALKSLGGVELKGVALRGTPAETERLDLIDGIIIELVRSARKAAKVLAKKLGEPAIVAAFELDLLYASRSK
jgi:polyhydroxyalkanoate synthesis regulator phasin